MTLTLSMLCGKGHQALLGRLDNANSCNEYIISSDTGFSTRSETNLKKMDIGFWHRMTPDSCCFERLDGNHREIIMGLRRAAAIYHFAKVTSQER